MNHGLACGMNQIILWRFNHGGLTMENWKMVIVIAKELERGIDRLKALENTKEVMECQLSEKDV